MAKKRKKGNPQLPQDATAIATERTGLNWCKCINTATHHTHTSPRYAWSFNAVDSRHKRNMVWLHVYKTSGPDLQLPPPGQAQLSSLLSVALGEPLARLHELDDVDELFSGHDGEGYGSENPWDGRVHFVCSVFSKYSVSIGASDKTDEEWEHSICKAVFRR